MHKVYQLLPQAKIASAALVTDTPLPTGSAPGLTASQSLKAFQATPEATPRAFASRGANQSADSANREVAELAGRQEDSAALARIRISGPPRDIVYPDCPDRARGKVSVQVVIDYDGTVSQVRALSGDRLLAAAAMKAIWQWRYQPFSGDAQKLERETRITVSFISGDIVAVSFPDAATKMP